MGKRTIHGRATLVCGDIQSSVDYKLILSIDKLGTRKATGQLWKAHAAVIAMASRGSTCRLTIEDGQELDIQIEQRGGRVHFRCKGKIPDL